jgi:triosephosphate isomerase
MAHRKIIIGNWKMNPLTVKEAEKLFSDTAKGVSSVKNTDIIICPPVLYLEKLAKIRTNKIKLGAQDAFWGDVGAHTGEVSAQMLYNAGVKYVLLGHSDKRASGQTNSDINRRVRASLAADLVPMLFIGESVRDESHNYFNLVKIQIEECLQGISKSLISKIIIAYEPVWAISSNPEHKDATSADCLEMTIFIRKVLSDKFGSDAGRIKIIYGGSANEKNSLDFLTNGGVDGVGAGRASLNAKKFTEIVKIAEKL